MFTSFLTRLLYHPSAWRRPGLGHRYLAASSWGGRVTSWVTSWVHLMAMFMEKLSDIYMKWYEITWNDMKLYEITWKYVKWYGIIWNDMELYVKLSDKLLNEMRWSYMKLWQSMTRPRGILPWGKARFISGNFKNRLMRCTYRTECLRKWISLQISPRYGTIAPV